MELDAGMCRNWIVRVIGFVSVFVIILPAPFSFFLMSFNMQFLAGVFPDHYKAVMFHSLKRQGWLSGPAAQRAHLFDRIMIGNKVPAGVPPAFPSLGIYTAAGGKAGRDRLS
jgi:hypothetical protein